MIGAPFSNNNGLFSGLARVFEYDGTQWIQFGKHIKGEDVADLSGFSVSLSGNGTTVAIGAPAIFSSGDENPILLSADSSSYVRVYQKNSITGNVQGSNTDVIDIDTSVHCDSVVMSKSAPSESSVLGTVGEIRVDEEYIYVCTASNTWKRASIATW